MTVAPLIAMKSTKCESLEAVGKELDRRAHTYANDVDQSGRHVGYLCRAGDESPVPLEQAIERRMGELNTKRKIRDNQVRAMGFIVSSNDALDEKDAREFLDRSVQWFGARYGYENLLAAQIHLDEGTPHAHIWHRRKRWTEPLAEAGEASRFKGLSQNENARPALSQAGGSFV